VASRLVAETGQAAEERADSVIGFAADASVAARAAEAITAAFGSGVAVTQAPVVEVDWSRRWRDGLGVRRIGRLSIGPSWLLAPGPLTVVIDPETAFGTGEHGSTRGALRLLDRRLTPGARVLDLGAGSGVLGIAAVKLGAATALGIELDEEAIPVAEANAARNAVSDRARFVAGDARLLAPLAGPVELVTTNILRNVNESLLEPIRATLVPGGVAVFAGLEAADADPFIRLLGDHGYQVFEDLVDDGWWSAAATPV
jgi:ribosomal protein L11 methyltransferase